MILAPLESVQKAADGATGRKRRRAPNCRFYLLYDKLYRKDVLTYAYQRCKANKGAPGIDGQEFADIEAYGEERWLGERRDLLRVGRRSPVGFRTARTRPLGQQAAQQGRGPPHGG